MMRLKLLAESQLNVLLCILSLALLSSCAGTTKGTLTYPSITFEHLMPIELKISRVEVHNQYTPLKKKSVC